MSFRFAISISVLLHLGVVCLGVVLRWDDLRVTVKQGQAGIAVRIADKKNKDRRKNRSFRVYASMESINIMFSPQGRHVAHVNNRQRSRDKQHANEQHARSKKVRGALVKKASLLSANYPPEYPYVARRFGYEGRVVLRIEVLPDGHAGSIVIHTSSGYGILDRAAVRAVKEWKFFEKGAFTLAASIFIKHAFLFKMEKY